MDASGEGGKGKARKVGMDGTDVTVGLGVGVGSENASWRNNATLTSSSNSVNSSHDKEKMARRSSVTEVVQSGFG